MFSNFGSGKANSQLDTLVGQLKSKLNNFAVKDRQSKLLGEVRDVIVDANRQLNLVVAESNVTQPRLFLLTSKLIQKVDVLNKLVLVNINKLATEQLPEYVTVEAATKSEASNMLVAEEELTKDISNVVPILFESKDEDKLNTDQIPSYAQNVLEEIISLLEERVVIDRNKRKVGEVIVRKEITTRMVQVQVPLRREKLIIEQVSPEQKKLVEIDLWQEDITKIGLPEGAILIPEDNFLTPTVRVLYSGYGQKLNQQEIDEVFISDEEKCQIMNDLACGNSDQETTHHLLQDDQFAPQDYQNFDGFAQRLTKWYRSDQTK